MDMKQKMIIGRYELCDLPELEIVGMRARIDTGAKTTALHAYNIETSVADDGQEQVTFNTHPDNKRHKKAPKITLPLIEKRKIISSNGIKEERLIVKIKIKMGEEIIATNVSLTSRHKMTFPLLIGRNTLQKGKFIVDVSLTRRLG
jgi:ribosomal protein S6--L-glutamate ligase